MEIQSPFTISKENVCPTPFAPYILRQIKRFGHQVALIDDCTGWTCTYHEIGHYVGIFCDYFHSQGLDSGSRVAILSLNCPQFLITQLAADLLGLHLIHVSPLATDEELIHYLGIAQCTCIISHPDFEEKSTRLVAVGASKRFIPLPLQASLSESSTPSPINHLGDRGSSSSRFVFFSSGTTGLPKAFEVPPDVLPIPVEQMSACPWSPQSSNGEEMKQERTLIVVPFTHIYGTLVSFYTLRNGYRVVTQPRFVPRSFLAALQKYQISQLVVAPPLVEFLANDITVDQYDLSHLYSITCSAAPLPAQIAVKCKERLHLKDMRQLYGMTEILTATWMPYGHPNCKSIGVPVPGNTAKFVDAETSAVIDKPHEEGELWISGPQIRGTYFNNEKATRETFALENGVLWCKTGDMGYFDQIGQLYLTDRCKDLIKCKGHQVSPSEIESILFQHPDVVDCAVVSRTDAKAGEVPMAFVKRKEGSQLDTQVLKDLIKGRLSSYKQLNGGIIFLDQLPRSANGKLLRRQLREILKKQQTQSKL